MSRAAFVAAMDAAHDEGSDAWRDLIAIEGVGAVLARSLVTSFAQDGERAAGRRPDRAHRQAQRLGDRGVVHVLEVAQDEDRAHPGRERREQAPQGVVAVDPTGAVLDHLRRHDVLAR